MRALVIDAYDSFVYTIVAYLKMLDVEVDVVRNDKATFDGIRESNPDFIVLGPGPGHPSTAGYIEIIDELKSEIPILGVCLGHQAIGLAFGATVSRAKHVMHGKMSRVTNDGKGCFSGCNGSFNATRYHSLVVDRDSIPAEELVVTATSEDDGYVMGLRHTEWPVESIQFHPESIMTESGLEIFKGFIQSFVSKRTFV